MKKSKDYLNDIKVKKNIRSDYELAKELNTSKQCVSRWQNGKHVMDDYTAYRVAEILELEPMEIIATANAERERNEERKNWWVKISESYASGLARTPSVLLGLTLFGEVFNFVKCILC